MDPITRSETTGAPGAGEDTRRFSTPTRRTNRSLIARQGAHALHAQYDSRELTQPARDKFLARFVEEVDPERTLSERERLRRAEHARKAYFIALARKSADARRAHRKSAT